MGVLFWRDIREKPNITRAIWLPIVWMFLVASKPVSQWLNIFGLPGFAATSLEEGSSLDAAVFLALIALGVYVLGKRQVRLSEIIRDNAWLTVFVLYCFLAIFWSDLPFVSLKRWIKVLGHPVMVLIIFTEPEPQEALARLIKRCAYVLLPVSILWMKYFPALGIKTTEWGLHTPCGIAAGGNALGCICVIISLFLLWHSLPAWRSRRSKAGRNELYLIAGLLLLVGYCLGKIHSATATISLLISALIMLFLGLRFVNKRLIGVYALTGIIILGIAQLTFDIFGIIVDLSGHESTIEGRGELWKILLDTDTNPILGTGFESYWLGEEAAKIRSIPGFQWAVEAHNGYLDLYLNLGIVGLLIFAGVIFATFWKISLELPRNLEWGRFQMGCLVAILLHNWTEAGFKGLSFPFLVFFLLAVNYPQLRMGPVAPSLEATGPEWETELVYSEDKI
jgi:O-antigen ligase